MRLDLNSIFYSIAAQWMNWVEFWVMGDIIAIQRPIALCKYKKNDCILHTHTRPNDVTDSTMESARATLLQAARVLLGSPRTFIGSERDVLAKRCSDAAMGWDECAMMTPKVLYLIHYSTLYSTLLFSIRALPSILDPLLGRDCGDTQYGRK